MSSVRNAPRRERTHRSTPGRRRRSKRLSTIRVDVPIRSRGRWRRPGQHRWIGRSWVARFLGIGVYVVPFAASVAAALALSAIAPPAATWPIAIIRPVIIATFSTVVLYVVDGGTRRLRPLAALLDLTSVLPDEAPSRFMIALRTGGTHQLQDRLTEYRQLGADEPARAAELLLGLVAELSRHDRLTHNIALDATAPRLHSTSETRIRVDSQHLSPRPAGRRLPVHQPRNPRSTTHISRSRWSRR